jgi:ubiquinone/menaquinone biosynthesis C-methylase UbiE/DNA-binding transcriptional ArsR family regulator
LFAAAPAFLDHLAVLSDATRSRILLLLDRNELTVSELCLILQLPQSTVSRHLRALTEDGWITVRSEGTSHWYASAAEGDPSSKRLWSLVREEVAGTPAALQDGDRLRSALAVRRARSQEFFAAAAQQWDRIRTELYGERFDLASLAALADPAWVAGDLGCGTGPVSAALAPFVREVVAVDESDSMLQAAEQRLSGFANVALRSGQLEKLPIEEKALDLATLVLVLHFAAEPERVLKEAARVLKPGGRIVVVDMLPHDREKYRQKLGHVWLGFPPETLRRMLNNAGFVQTQFAPIPRDNRAKGPALFIARADRASEADNHMQLIAGE